MVRPPDRVAILTASGTNQVDFTGDQAKPHEALFRLAPRPQRSTGCPEIDDYEAYLVDGEHSADTLAVVHAEAIQCDCGENSTEVNPTTKRPAMLQNQASHDACPQVASRGRFP